MCSLLVVIVFGALAFRVTQLQVLSGNRFRRMSLHQTQNTGDGELVLIAFTDYGLTRRAYVNEPTTPTTSTTPVTRTARPEPNGASMQAMADAEE